MHCCIYYDFFFIAFSYLYIVGFFLTKNVLQRDNIVIILKLTSSLHLLYHTRGGGVSQCFELSQLHSYISDVIIILNQGQERETPSNKKKKEEEAFSGTGKMHIQLECYTISTLHEFEESLPGMTCWYEMYCNGVLLASVYKTTTNIHFVYLLLLN